MFCIYSDKLCHDTFMKLYNNDCGDMIKIKIIIVSSINIAHI